MKYKLAIGNVITFEVAGKLTETATQAKNFKFKLTCERLDQDSMSARMQDQGESLKDFLASVTTGWAEQRLVLNEDDTPAEFCPEAFTAMLSLAGMPMFLYQAYVKAVAVKEKN